MALGASPAGARITVSDTARTYVQARAAAMSGDHARAAQLLAALAEAQPDQADLARKALSEAVGAGDMPLALSPGARRARGQAADRCTAAAGDRGDQAAASGAGLQWLSPAGGSGDLGAFRAPDHRMDRGRAR